MSTEAQLQPAIFKFALFMGDNCLILAQQLSAWTGHAPILEEDIAIANTALDLIGQTQFWLGLAGEVEGKGRNADQLAFLRDSREYRNCLLVEQPNGDFGHTLMRQFLFDAWHILMLKGLAQSSESRFAEIANKAVKEVTYHVDRTRDLIIRLGDGTSESHDRMQAALDQLWPFTEELTEPAGFDELLMAERMIPNLAGIKSSYQDMTRQVLADATLQWPEGQPARLGGKDGLHGEALGFILAEMQHLQRAYPGASW